MNFLHGVGKNIRIIESFIRPGGSGAEPPTLANFYVFTLNFSLANLIFPKIRGSAPKTKDDNSVLSV